MMKKKYYYFFLSFTFVSILPFDAVDCSVAADNYTCVVRCINYALQHCTGGMMADLIEEFVRRDLPIEEISYMFAVPEKANRHLQHSIDREFEIRHQLSTLMAIPVPPITRTDPVPDMTLLPGLGTERRGIVRNAMQIVIQKFSLGTMDNNLCRSLGLLRSVLDPESYINSFNIELGTCMVVSTIGDTVKSSKYKYVGGVILQVQINDTNRTEPLSYEKAW
ncbi:uncharacterized protein LOC126833869 [Adelges cooleyi]|uniref:uncharacterized protein LOC126833869 n=1 Tax=Adelges cooleyi TaxID=133065 RepID=UPI0021807EC7|nr:uncharacterized protein LOC126833869 [Adelges cooleyi]